MAQTTTKEQKEDNQTFDQFLKKNLSKYIYDNLATKLNLTPNRVTKFKKNPSVLTMEELSSLMGFLGGKYSFNYLMENYGAGLDRMTAREYLMMCHLD